MRVTLPAPISLFNLHKQFTLAQGEINEPDTLVDSFSSCSEDVVPGTLFIACRGVGADGHDFIEKAFSKGASAAVVSNLARLDGKPGFEASNSRALVSRLCAYAYQNPSHSMKVIGVTGTNGKTTTNWLLYHSLRSLGAKALRVGTLGFEISDGASSEESLTTPGPEDIHKILAQARDAGCQFAVMEVSSHALHQQRVDDVAFDAAIFTNITHDHLDYHRTFDEYFKAKRRLFELLKVSKKDRKIFCSNFNFVEGEKVAHDFARSFDFDRSISYDDKAFVRIKNITRAGTKSIVTLEIEGGFYELTTSFLGKHNAENLAQTFGVLHGFGYTPHEIAAAIAKVPAVPGRLEPFEYNGVATYVDYAHSPDALERVLSCLREIADRRLLLMFGCGGDRDWRKRPVMGDIAARLADYIVVTSDNPRTEDPQRIVDDILSGELVAGGNCRVEVDRAEAIRAVLSEAREGDVVLIAGKGHENYQIVGKDKRHFSDQEEIRKFFGVR